MRYGSRRGRAASRPSAATPDVIAGENRPIERRLALALRAVDGPPDDVLKQHLNDDLSSGELLQLAWDRAGEEIDALRTELRLIRQRHQEAEHNLLARINQRKRLKQHILESAGGPALDA